MSNVDYGEIFCDAVDAIVSKKLEELKYDITKVCTIIDDSFKKIGKYIVKEEVLQYEAYSTDTNLNIGDFVLVMIPNGEYNSQKIILNKIIRDNDLSTMSAYVSPLKSMLNFSGNIIEKDSVLPDLNSGVINNKYFSLLANENNTYTSKLLYTIDWRKYNSYKKIGISAEFKTLLNTFNVTSGEYGLEFLFYDHDKTVVDQELKNATYRFSFNTNDLLGDPYNFMSYFKQEKVIDISHMSNIEVLNIYFYQKGNFKDENGILIASTNQVGNATERKLDNLFVGNIEIQSGYDINEYKTDTITLTSSSSSYYTQNNTDQMNKKDLSLYWVHKIDDNNYEIIDSTNGRENEVEVYWVRYNSKQSDINSAIVGANWTFKDEEIVIDSLNNFNAELLLTEENRLIYESNVRVKAVCRIRDEENNWLQYDSNIITFSTEDSRVDTTTYEAIMGLSLQCQDNTYGNYFLYNSNDEIIDESQGQGYNRTLKIMFDGKDLDLHDKFKSENITSITWDIPRNTSTNPAYTMLIYPNNNNLPEEGNTVSFTNGSSLQYNISNYLHSTATHNTISCEILLKNGEVYKTSKELLFGKVSNSGSNLNLIVQYVDPKINAFEVITDDSNKIANESKGKVNGVEIIALLYNMSGQLIQDKTITWNLQNNTIFTFESGTEEQQGKGILYIKDTVDTLRSSFAIIQVSCESNDQTVTTYFPIAIKTRVNNESTRCDTMAGARKVIYNAMGVPNYYTGIYQLFQDNQAIDDIDWELVYGSDGKKSGYPELKDTSGGKALSASPVFITDNNYQLCVIGKNKDGVIYWIQPILIMQSAYDFAIVNQWDGTETMETGTEIVTSVLAAGHKNTDNSFSGIVMGDIKMNGEEDLYTGLCGISKGAVTFRLADTGNAYFGTAGIGEDPKDRYLNIEFGENNRICCARENGNNDKDAITLDFDDGIFTFERESGSGSLRLAADQDGYLILTSRGKTILEFKETDNVDGDVFLLQSSNYDATTNAGLQIDLKSGIIKGKETDISFSKGNNYIGTIGSGDVTSCLLKLGKLEVRANGEVFYNGKDLADFIK